MAADSSSTTLEQLMTPFEVADALRVSEIALARWRRAGSGPKFLKLSRGRSGLIRYRREDVADFLESITRRSTSDSGR
jgi:predicted site-specific integrase-resolvase